MGSSLENGLLTLLARLPHVAIEVIAIVIAIVRWKRHPVVSLLVVVASTVNLLAMTASAVVPMALQASGLPMQSMGVVFAGLGLLGDVSLALLLAAVFIDRPVEPKPAVDYGTAP